MLQATITCKQGTHTFDFDGSENGLYQKLGELAKWIPAPDTISVKVGTRTVMIDRKLGQYGNAFNQLVFSDLDGLTPSMLPWKMLKKIDADHNIYNQYEMIPHSLGNRTMSYTISKGRIGAIETDINRVKLNNFQISPILFWMDYYDKLQDGYVDYSDMSVQNLPEAPILKAVRTHLSTDEIEASNAELAKSPAFELYQVLSTAAEEFIQTQLDSSMLQEKMPFTELQITKAREIWNTLGKSKNVDDFNKKIKKILALAPRRIDAYHGQTVQSYLAAKVDDQTEQMQIMSDIIDREDALIQSMEAVFFAHDMDSTQKNIVEKVFDGIEIERATDEEIQYIKDTMFTDDAVHSQGLISHIKRVWKINNTRQDKRFKEYCKERNIADKDSNQKRKTRYLFHGSRTQNWISIINNSLLLNPNAQINGKCFGQGIYFAPSAHKSFCYTSAKWCSNVHSTAMDCSSFGYMGVFETAYGNSADSAIVDSQTQEWMDKNGYDCLHYHAGSATNKVGLARDEIVFYNESAMTIRYLIEFGDDSETA